MEAPCANWIVRWQAAHDACQRKGGEAAELVIAPPASSEEVNEIERGIGHVLPSSFRQVLINLAASVQMQWLLPENIQIPEPYRQFFAGECSWELSQMVQLAVGYQLWLDMPYNVGDPNDDPLWHDKLAFIEVGNGDIIAFDLKFMPDPPVVFLSHDDGEAHGVRLGDNFIDFMDRHTLLGCPGYEDVQMMPFLPDATSGLDAYGENARKWREWFGLDFEVDKR